LIAKSGKKGRKRKVQQRWNETESGNMSALDQLVYQSRLVGAEESLVLWGGGNNSVKDTGTDLLGQTIPIMYIKGSGSDMKSIVPRQFPAVRLDYIEPLLERDSLSDEDMVAYLARCLLDPAAVRPSIETLLHAFLPWRAVLHTHADAILALTNTNGREQTVRECFGDSVITVPYLLPGFKLSKLVGLAGRQNRNADGLILMNHGLITWGDTPQAAYEKHIELVTRAEEFAAGKRTVVTVNQPFELSQDERQNWAREIAPLLRGLLGKENGVILKYDDSPATLDFLARPDLSEITQKGPATPDHLLYTGRFPLVVNLSPATNPERQRAQLTEALENYVTGYRGYFERNAPQAMKMLEPYPRIVLIPGLGMWTAGKDTRAATIVADIYKHTMGILADATALGGFATLSEPDAFNAEYWELELYKLSLLPKEKDLARKVALVTGAASGIGRAIARRLAEEGAHVVVTDLNLEGAEAVAAEIRQKNGLGRALGLATDVTDEASVHAAMLRTVLEYGGLDVLVSNAGVAHVGAIDRLALKDWERSLAVNTTGHFLVVREALELMKRQGTGGSLVFNATKNVTAPGKDFGAYSVAKAAEAQLCRIVAIEAGEYGIRANMLNPDAIFEGSQLWSEDLKQQRAAAYGLPVENLPDFYRQRNLLKAAVTAEDVAEAALFLASARSGKTTGAMLPVDGGVKEAFPR
jgi:rhamnulose-1-phosphate aldolase/alcohol dehydrogenase